MAEKRNHRVVLHAPSIHTGGGLELLKGLMDVCSSSFDILQLDRRIRNGFPVPEGSHVRWVSRSVTARLYAEWKLFRESRSDDTVLCFHGLPPLFPVRGRVVVFAQNRILFESGSLAGYPFLTRIRLAVERVWVRQMRRHCGRYIVQTSSMAAAVRKCLGSNVDVAIQPFWPPHDLQSPERSSPASPPRLDFVYVSSGDAHKNHHNLLEAWRVLADAGLRPSLTLTVSAEAYPSLASEIARHAQRHELNIVNAGYGTKEQIQRLYQTSSALIFPSLLESFGLPLLEASQLGLPVLAPELDYVRDLIEPAQTFDPTSPLSIARAVRRFLGHPEAPVRIGSAQEFLAQVCK